MAHLLSQMAVHRLLRSFGKCKFNSMPNACGRYYVYVKHKMIENLDRGTTCRDFPVTPPRLISLLRAAVPERGLICLDNGLYKVGPGRDRVHNWKVMLTTGFWPLPSTLGTVCHLQCLYSATRCDVSNQCIRIDTQALRSDTYAKLGIATHKGAQQCLLGR